MWTLPHAMGRRTFAVLTRGRLLLPQRGSGVMKPAPEKSKVSARVQRARSARDKHAEALKAEQEATQRAHAHAAALEAQVG